MSAAAILQLVNLATLLIEEVVPHLTKALKSGEISVEQQQELKGKIAALKAKLEADDLGSQWEIPDRP